MNVDSIPLDDHSLKILFELQRDARQTVQQISEAVGLSPTPVLEAHQGHGGGRRDPRLHRAWSTARRSACTWRRWPRSTSTATARSQVQRFEEAVAASPQIVRCVSATGPADYILTVLVPDMKHYERFLHETLFSLPGVTHVRSSIVLRRGEVRGGAADRAGGAAGRAGARAAALRG